VTMKFDESMTLNSLRGEVRKEGAEDSGFLEWWTKSKLIDSGFCLIGVAGAISTCYFASREPGTVHLGTKINNR
jgi:hypothetical protein